MYYVYMMVTHVTLFYYVDYFILKIGTSKKELVGKHGAKKFMEEFWKSENK